MSRVATTIAVHICELLDRWEVRLGEQSARVLLTPLTRGAKDNDELRRSLWLA